MDSPYQVNKIVNLNPIYIMKKTQNFIGILIIILLLPIKTIFYFVWNVALIILILLKLNFLQPEDLTDKLKSILKQ